MPFETEPLQRSASCNHSDLPCRKALPLLSMSMMYSKSASNLLLRTCENEDHEILRCRSEGALPQRRSSQSALAWMTRWTRGRVSSDPGGVASNVNQKSNAPQADNLLSLDPVIRADEVKRRWRHHQIASQQRLVQSQRSWWAGWMQRNRCALDIAHRQK